MNTPSRIAARRERSEERFAKLVASSDRRVPWAKFNPTARDQHGRWVYVSPWDGDLVFSSDRWQRVKWHVAVIAVSSQVREFVIIFARMRRIVLDVDPDEAEAWLREVAARPDGFMLRGELRRALIRKERLASLRPRD